MDPETELGSHAEEATPLSGVVEEDASANMIPPPPETLVVKMRGRPAGSRNKTKAENPIIVSESAPQAHNQPDPMYTALMKRLDAMDGMLAQRQAEIVKKRRLHQNPGRQEWKGIYHRSQLRKRNLESRDHQGPHPDS